MSPVLLDTHTITFEMQCICIRSTHRSVLLLNIYRPPHSAASAEFFTELGNVIAATTVHYSGPVLLVGDLNCHSTTPGYVDDKLLDLLTSLDFVQHVTKPTRGNQILDIVASSSHCSPILSVSVQSSHEISDHLLVKARLDLGTNAGSVTTRSWRPLKCVDFSVLDERLLNSTLVTDPPKDADEYANLIASVVSKELDLVAPT